MVVGPEHNKLEGQHNQQPEDYAKVPVVGPKYNKL